MKPHRTWLNAKCYEDFTKTWQKREQELRWLYFTQGWSLRKVAEYYKVCRRTVQEGMLRLGIQPRGKGHKGQEHPSYKHGKASRLYRVMVQKDKCIRCVSTDRLVILHKNCDHFDNRLENLEVLCTHCHLSESKRAWWAAKRAGKALPMSNCPPGWERQKAL